MIFVLLFAVLLSAVAFGMFLPHEPPCGGRAYKMKKNEGKMAGAVRRLDDLYGQYCTLRRELDTNYTPAVKEHLDDVVGKLHSFFREEQEGRNISAWKLARLESLVCYSILTGCTVELPYCKP